MFHARILIVVAYAFAILCDLSTCYAADPPATGPTTENRFPPLQVPPGFKATLFACDPLIEYPSAISVGPRPGSIFVAVDYMTGLGTDIVRRSEVRLVEDTDGDGYADKATGYAGGLNSIMGLAWNAGTLYVMHAPFLTAFRDTKGTGVADERTDIVCGLGLTPEENPVRLHCANGVTIGHDGWLYLSLGDHGCDVRRPEGDRLVFEGGGILRCRADGRDLHVFATGLRNIYDVALDAELNVFVRDNENDGGDYKIRVCHSFFGADHGYPYLYYEDPQECLRPLADLGLGSSAGGVCYLETQIPVEYRGDLFFCEWGKSLVRYPLKPLKNSFEAHSEIEFAVGAANDPYGFKPTDVVVQTDGSLMVADYADGQRPKRGRGRIYHLVHTEGVKRQDPPDIKKTLAMLDSESYSERCRGQAAIEHEGEPGWKRLAEAIAAGQISVRGRLHAIWILAHLRGDQAIEPLMDLASSDPDPAVRAQSVRAIADLVDPVLAQHRLDAGPGDARIAARLAALSIGADSRIALEVVVALSRLRWFGAADWLTQNLKSDLTEADAALAHASMQLLRRSGNWPSVLQLLDGPAETSLRRIALRAISRQYSVELVDGLVERVTRESDTTRLSEYATCLARVHQTPGPWVYWGYRPAPRPANQVAWERTDAVGHALNRLLGHEDHRIRFAALQPMQREQVPAKLEALGAWLQQDNDPQHVAAILNNLKSHPVAEAHSYLEPVIREQLNSSANRLTALALYNRSIDAKRVGELLDLCQQLEDGEVLAAALRLVSNHSQIQSIPLFVQKLDSSHADVRAAAIQSLGTLKAHEGRASLMELLGDEDPNVRRATAEAAGRLEARQVIEPLLKLAGDSNGLVRAASLNALRQLKEQRAVPLAIAALRDRQTDQIALDLLHELGGPEQATAIAQLGQHNPPRNLLTSAVQTLTDWRGAATAAQKQELDQAVAELQGASGNLIGWWVTGPTTNAAENAAGSNDLKAGRLALATGLEGRFNIDSSGAAKESWYVATTDVAVPQQTAVELLITTGGSLEVWLNGNSAYERKQSPKIRGTADRIAMTLAAGTNRLAIALQSVAEQSSLEVQVQFRRKSNTAEHEKLAAISLARPGNPQRGRVVFLDSEKSQCIKCHRLNELGERIGPELTGLGKRFSRIHIVESILEPSRSMAPSFGSMTVALKNGKVVSGIKITETESTLTLADNQAQKHVLEKSEIEEQQVSAISTMPDGLEKKLTQDEFVDLVAFLASLVDETR